MRFSDIYGQNEVKERLIRSVKEERLAHAILLYGPEGSGKLALAIAFAQYVACTNKKEGDACGECPSCLKYQKLIHPDLHFVFPVILEIHKFSEGGIVEWREQILDTPYFSFEKWSEKLSPEIGNKHANKQLVISVAEAAEIVAEMHKTTFESDYKITIVNFADKMNIQCANKLLKIIEEPFPKTLFIFICDDPNKLLPTITSRLQKIYVPSLPSEEVEKAIKDRYPSNTNIDLKGVARVANGNIVKAFDLVENGDSSKEYFEKFVEIMRTCYTRNIRGMRNWSEELSSEWNRKKLISLLQYFQRLVRENFISNVGQKELNYMTNEESNFSLKFAPFINERNICQFLSELELAERHIERNGQVKIILFDLTLKLTMLLKM